MFTSKYSSPYSHRDETIDDIRKTVNVIDFHSGSNFIAFFKLHIDSGDELLRKHVECSPKNASYTSWLVQNEIIQCIHKSILNEIFHQVENRLFSIIVDETISDIILDYLTTHNLPFDNCVGQAYDGIVLTIVSI